MVHGAVLPRLRVATVVIATVALFIAIGSAQLGGGDAAVRRYCPSGLGRMLVTRSTASVTGKVASFGLATVR